MQVESADMIVLNYLNYSDLIMTKQISLLCELLWRSKITLQATQYGLFSIMKWFSLCFFLNNWSEL